MSDETNKVTMFCANEQDDTEQVLDVDGNGEITLTCECGRFIKLPATTDAAGLKAYIDEHKAANMGQISQDSIEAKKAELIAGLKADEAQGAV